MTDELPPGWARAPLAVIGVWGSGGTPSRGDPKAYGGTIPWLKIGDLSDGRVEAAAEAITEHGLRNSSAKLLEAETLLVAMYGSIGKLGITTMPCATNQAIAFCRPAPGIDLRYLFYALMSERHRLIEQGQGGAQLNISQAILKAHEVPIAPTNEQHRIVSKIDEIFSRVEEGERALERVGQLVEHYRQSVLKAAVTGELTRDWREKNKGKLESGEALLARILKARREAWEKAEVCKMKAKGITLDNDKWKQRYEAPSPPDISGLPELPPDWVWATVDQLCKEFGNGLSKKPGHRPPGIPILRISAVRPLAIDAADLRYYVPDEGESVDMFRVEDGDLLFTRYNGSKDLVGVSGVFRGSQTVLHPDKLIRARVVSEDYINPDYMAIALNCGWSKKHLNQWVKTSAGQHGIAGSDTKRAPVPLPPFAEQVCLNDLVSVAMSKCNDAAATAGSKRRRAQAFRQSILRTAFAGQLVPQDDSDEAAALLLARVSDQREGSTAKAKRRPKSEDKLPA